ncbi:MAG: SDR family oxidoreductase [Chloroflexi bacterium]|nr:SDR family oxidoreductase [Chloroflexota bacterium]
MLLENKNAIVYGAGGGIGGGVARTFAREGARVFLVGRTRAKLEAVAADITAAGGAAEVAVVDATDEQAVNQHVQAVVARAGHLDISINLITHGDTDAGGYVQGIPLVDIPAADFFRPIIKGVLSNYITAQAAARQMVQQRSGAILTLTNASSMGGSPLMGSTGVVAAAIESFARTLASEVGEHGVRVLGVKIAAVPELFTKDLRTDVFEKDSGGLDSAGITAALAQMTMLRRVTTLAQVADVVAFLASEQAGGMTGTIINITGGMVIG